jgi:hypothetical protein
MTYRISYDAIHASSRGRAAADDVARIEYYRTEHEALNRARELLETSEHQAVSMADSAGNVLGGFRLQLKLGYTGE